MKPGFSAPVFSVAFCAAYVAAFALNAPLFSYYPLPGTFVWGGRVLPDAGPSMAWYGLMATAAAVALPLAAVLPERWILARVRRGLWLVPCAAILACAWLLRHFFAG
jgi:hypothetical protein